MQHVTPARTQEELLHTLLAQGDAALHEQIQAVWPLDVAAAFGALPTPLRLHADPRFTGKGVTMALIDVGFYRWSRSKPRSLRQMSHRAGPNGRRATIDSGMVP